MLMQRWAFLIVWVGVLGLVQAQNLRGSEDIGVGVTASLTGQYAEFGREQLNGMQMWADDLNARGALLGREVALVSYDDQSDPHTSARLYERLILEDKVDLLLGPYSSDVTLAASTVAEDHDLPMLAAGATAGEIWSRGYRNIFGIDNPADDHAGLLLAFAKEKGLRRIALVYAGAQFPREVARGVREQAAAHGLEIVFDEEYDERTKAFGDVVRRVARTKPDVMIGGTYLNDSITLVRQAKARGFAPKVLAFTVSPALRAFGDILGPDAEGIMSVVPWIRSARMPRAQDFSYRYKMKYGHDADYHAAAGYAAGQALEAAVRLAGSTEGDAVRKQLGSMKFRSLLGHYRVNEKGEQVGKDTYVMQWQDDRRVLVLPASVAERPPLYPFPAWGTR
jgi:branched-chain amino acid transport system substrate-binding protein